MTEALLVEKLVVAQQRNLRVDRGLEFEVLLTRKKAPAPAETVPNVTQSFHLPVHHHFSC